MAVNPKKLRPYDEPPKVRRSLIPSAPDSAATAFLVVSVLWLAVATGIGALWAAYLLFPDLLSFRWELPVPVIGTLAIELSQQTVLAGFINALVYGWVSNAGFAAIMFMAPRLVGTRLRDETMGFGAMGLWNLGVAVGLATVYLPTFSAGGMLVEFPILVDGLLLLGAATVMGALFRTLWAAERRLPYVSILYFGVALLAFLGLYALSSASVLLNLDATAQALIDGFAARGILTYWVLGVTLGSLFYVVPRASGNPLASSGMALASWLLWAAFAGLSALAALVDPSVPYAVTSIGNAGTILLLAPVFLAVADLILSLQGRWTFALITGTLSFALTAMAFLLGAWLLEAVGALRSVDALVRGTEWRLGVLLLGVLGAATFALLALADHAAPRVLKRDWRGGITVDVQLWAIMVGVTVAGLALIGGGIAHGSLAREGGAPEAMQGVLSWFWMAAGAGLGLAALGGLAAAISLFLIYTTARRAEYVPAAEPVAGSTPATQPAR